MCDADVIARCLDIPTVQADNILLSSKPQLDRSQDKFSVGRCTLIKKSKSVGTPPTLALYPSYFLIDDVIC